MRAAGACVAALAACAPAWADDAMPSPLGGRAGDPARGLALMQERQKSLCVLCHSGPFAEPQLSGTLAPDLAGVGGRLTAGQIRLRIVDMKRINPDTIMPAYLEAAGEDRRVAPAWRGRTILEPQEIEDIVAYLATSGD
ncbi:MAG TPA: sulfur oxidation c-type cytochrome SoxX [Geminicoccaceae bacterium]|nr:sulfur oxidation c-type cytochrome SoxX [Geminicoccus sp.]HMU48960.1 sulfur oxidation c-type cytochrome SoxX [Geminicoccaceae bacterium]